MGVQVIGSGGQQVTAVGVPTKQVNAAAVRISGGSGGVPDHNDTTNRDAVDAHPISAITGLQDALDALTGGGGSNLRVDVAIADGNSDIDLDGAAPGDLPAVLVWGRASGNGVYEASVADGWTLLDPQPTLVVADTLAQAPSYDQVLDNGVASIYDYSDTAGWQPVGSVPTLDGNPSQVWGPTGWVTPDGGASALADLTDVDVTSDPPAQDDVLAWDDTENKWTPATLDGGADLSDAAPQDLGTAASGVSDEASRADHVHDMPTAADIAVDASGFNGNLTTSDDTVQEIAQKLDDLVIPAAGIADPGGSNDDFLQRKSGAWTNRTIAQVKTDLNTIYTLDTPVGFWTGPLSSNALDCNQTDLFLGAGGRGSALLAWLPAGTYDRVAIGVSSVGTATLRVGLWTADRTTGLPASLALDAGTVSVAGSTGFREITISATLTAGWYWCSVSADAYTAAFNLWGMGNTASAPIFGVPLESTDARMRARNAIASAGFGTGGLPGTFPTVTNFNSAGPKMILRRSA